MRHLVILLVLSACNPDKSPVDETGVEVDWPTGVDPASLDATLQDLSAETMGGRLTGTPTGQLAEDYVVAHLASSGFEVQTQEVPLAAWDIGTPIDLSLVDESDAVVTSLAYIDQYREVQWSGSASVTGDLVFVGHGYADDYAGLDVTGQVVAMVNSGNFNTVYERAYAKGALAVLFLPIGDLGDYDMYYGELYIPKLFYGEIDPADLLPDFPALLVRRGAVDDLIGVTISELEADPTPFDPGLRVHVELNGTGYPETTCRNVFAFLEGSGDEIVGIGAHYDHIGRGGDGTVYCGASDNASGTAAILEIARSLSSIPRVPDRSVFMALWCGEELGIYGSYFYADEEPLWPLAQTALYVNLDNISDLPGPYLVRDEQVDIQEDFLAPSADLDIEEQDIGFVCGSDECPLYRQGVPFLRYMSFGSIGHTREDTYENANLDAILLAADATLRGTVAVAWSPE